MGAAVGTGTGDVFVEVGGVRAVGDGDAPGDIVMLIDEVGDGDAPFKECPECGAEVPAAVKECPLCGYDNTPPPTERPRSAPQHIDDHLKEVKATDITPLQHIPQNVNKAQYKRLVDRWINEMLEKKYKIGWLLHRMEWKNGTLTEEQKKELINAVTKLEAHRTSGGNGSNA